MNDESLVMLQQFLDEQYDPMSFSYDFPMEAGDMMSSLLAMDRRAGLAYGELVDACSWFDPYDTGDPDTIDEKEFRAKAKVAYDEAMRVLAKKAV